MPIKIHATITILVAVGLYTCANYFGLLESFYYYSSYDALGKLAQFSPNAIRTQLVFAIMDLLVFIPLYSTLLWRLNGLHKTFFNSILLSALVAADLCETVLEIYSCAALPFEEPFYFSALAISAGVKITLGAIVILYQLLAWIKRSHESN